MNKIKRSMVEELLNTEKQYDEEHKKNPRSELFNELSHRLFNLHVALEVEVEGSDKQKQKEEWFVINLTKAFAKAGKSISRLIKCLEVCGIEVEE